MPIPSDDINAGRIDTGKTFVPIHIAVLTVSDTRTRDDDVSGDTLVVGAWSKQPERSQVADQLTGKLRLRSTPWALMRPSMP